MSRHTGNFLIACMATELLGLMNILQNYYIAQFRWMRSFSEPLVSTSRHMNRKVEICSSHKSSHSCM